MWLPVVALALSATLAELPLAGRNASSAVARRRAQSRHRVPMNGACAVVARSNTWTKDPTDKEVDPDTGELHEIGGEKRPMWDYRVKVDPWQVFGNVEIEVVGDDIVVEHVWAASVVEMENFEPEGNRKGGVRVKVELDNTPQDDQQFDIDGTGTPSVAPTIKGCENLEPVEADCKLIARYSMLNVFEGTVSSKVHLETWQEGAMVSLDFGDEVQISEAPPAMKETQQESEWGRGIIGSMDAPPPSPPPLLEHTEATSSGMDTLVTALGTLSFGIFVLVVIRIVQALNDPQRRMAKLRPKGLRSHQGDDASMPMMEADEESMPTTKLHIEVSPEERCALKISMEGIEGMEDLQDLVAEVCDEAGYHDLDDLVMSYKRDDGEYTTVTRSVTIEMLKASPALRLAPANAAPKKPKASKKATRKK